jgi:AcrR family transcriptional regulator
MYAEPMTTEKTPITRAEQAERTRRLVLETAQRLFAEHGYDATSLQMIADAMGVRKANVYYYFHTKAEILEAAVAPTFDAMRQLLDEGEAIRGKRERTERLVAGFAELMVASRAITALTMSDPVLRRQKEVDAPVLELRARAERLLFGDDPTPDERLAYYLINAVPDFVAELAHLSDQELRDTLTRTCRRLLRVR